MPKVVGQFGQHRLDPLSAVSGKRPENRSTDEYRPGTQRQGHEYIQSRPDSTVDHHWDAITH